MINNFSIFKNEKKQKANEPDYSISAKIGEKYTNIGGCWIKEGKSGKYISCQLSKQYKDRSGFQIIPLDDDKEEYPTEDKVNVEDIPEEEIPF